MAESLILKRAKIFCKFITAQNTKRWQKQCKALSPQKRDVILLTKPAENCIGSFKSTGQSTEIVIFSQILTCFFRFLYTDLFNE